MYRLPVFRVALVREATVATEARAVRCPGDAATVLRALIGDYDREALAILLLNTKHRIIAGHIASVGTLDSAATSPREIFRAAILAGAKAIVLGHNHPSGDPEPSRYDLAFTRRLLDAGSLLGIPLLDHIIIGDRNYVSLAERGALPRSQR